MRIVSRAKSASTQPAGESFGSTSERLLDTAARLFWTKGYASTTTREIAALLGVQKASLYHHVTRKEDLLYEICVTSLEHIRSTVQAQVDSVANPLERIEVLIRAHVAAMLADQAKHSTMLTELRALSEDRRLEVIALRDSYEEFVRSVLDKAQQAGVIRNDIPVKYLAMSLLNLLNWTIFWYRSEGDLTAGRVVDLFSAIYLNGVRGDIGMPSPVVPVRRKKDTSPAGPQKRSRGTTA